MPPGLWRRAPCARAGMVYFVFRHHCLLACLNSNILKHESKLRHSCLTDGRLCCRLYVWTWGRCLCLFGSSEVAFFSLEAVDVAEEHPRQVDHRSQCSRSLSNKFDHVEHRGFLPGRSATRQLGNSAIPPGRSATEPFLIPHSSFLLRGEDDNAMLRR